MTISTLRKHLAASLVIGSAAIFGSTAGAAAADLTSNDPQAQARELLAPTKPSRPVARPDSSSLSNGVVASVIDPQESARRLLAGAHGSEHPTVAAPAGRLPVGRYAPSDTQALAQRMILGARGAAKTYTAATAATRTRQVLE